MRNIWMGPKAPLNAKNFDDWITAKNWFGESPLHVYMGQKGGHTEVRKEVIQRSDINRYVSFSHSILLTSGKSDRWLRLRCDVRQLSEEWPHRDDCATHIRPKSFVLNENARKETSIFNCVLLCPTFLLEERRLTLPSLSINSWDWHGQTETTDIINRTVSWIVMCIMQQRSITLLFSPGLGLACLE